MKVHLVLDSLSRDGGGVMEAERRLHQHLADLGVQTSVYALNDAFSEVDISSWRQTTPRVFPIRGPNALGASPELWAALSDEPADLIYRAGLWRLPSYAAARWKKKYGKPEVIAPHGMLDPWAFRNSHWKKVIAKALYEGSHLHHATCIRALCASEADSIRAFGLKNPICLVPNGVEIPEENAESGNLKADTGRKTLLFLGRLHPKKGLPNALRAWAKIRGQESGARGRDEWQFVVAGWDQGGHEAELKRLCDELGLKWADVPAEEFVGCGEELSVVGCPLPVELDVGASSFPSSPQMPGSRLEQGASTRIHRQPTTDNGASVVFTGPAFGNAKDQLLRQAHAFILPSFSEGLPMAVLEAWAYRLPVLMTDHCNLPEGFASEAAIRIDTGIRGQEPGVRSRGAGDRDQPMGIDVGMRALFEMTGAERMVMGQRGRALVEQHFTWPQVAARMKEVYEWLLGGGGKPNCVIC